MFQFLKQYIKNPGKIGAVAPSSRVLARAMVKPVEFSTASCIVEFGPGTGVFTEKLINMRKKDTVLFLIEQNKEFYKLLNNKRPAFICFFNFFLSYKQKAFYGINYRK